MDLLSPLPPEILSEIFRYLLLTTPNPIGRVSDKHPAGFYPTQHLRLRRASKTSELGIPAESVRYLHPLLNLRLVSRRFEALVEEFCEHILRSGRYCRPPQVAVQRTAWKKYVTATPGGEDLERTTPARFTIRLSGVQSDLAQKNQPAPYAASNSTSTPSDFSRLLARKASFQLMVMVWEFCVYCGEHARRVDAFLRSFCVCRKCEIPTISLHDLKTEFGLTTEVVEDPQYNLRGARVNASNTDLKFYGKLRNLELKYPLHKIYELQERLRWEKEQEAAWEKEYNSDGSISKEALWLEALRAGMLANGLEPEIKIIGQDSPSFEVVSYPLKDHHRLRREGLLRTKTCAEIVRYHILLSRIINETNFFTAFLPYINNLGQRARHSDGSSASSRRYIEFIKAFQVDSIKIRLMSLDLLDVALFLLYKQEFGLWTVSSAPQDIFKQYLQINKVWGPDILMPWSLDIYPVLVRSPPSPPAETLAKLPPSVRKQYYTHYPLEKHVLAYQARISQFVKNPRSLATNLLNPGKYARTVRVREWVGMGLYGPEDETGLPRRSESRGNHGRLEIWENRSIMNTGKSGLSSV